MGLTSPRHWRRNWSLFKSASWGHQVMCVYRCKAKISVSLVQAGMTSVLELGAPHLWLLDTVLTDKYRKATGQPLKQPGGNFAQHPCCSFSLSSAVHGIYSWDKNHVMVWLMPLALLFRTDLTFFSENPRAPEAVSSQWRASLQFTPSLQSLECSFFSHPLPLCPLWI